jgi:hypothetical protein
VERARERWTAGERLEAGRRLYEALLPELRPRWAGRLLGLACSRLSPPRCVEQVVDIAFYPSRWHEAHEAFRAVRLSVLAQERGAGPRDAQQSRLFALAETVAKVAYNASGAPAPFDFHAGWHAPERLFALLELWADAALEAEALRLVFGERTH